MDAPSISSVPREDYLPAGSARIFFRDIGAGTPLIILHGGPGFDHSYLLPELDGLAKSCRLITYDQRGRGRSAASVDPDDVSLESEISDVETVRSYFNLESAGVLGHSWGALLAIEYAARFPSRVSHLILMNPAPVSNEGFLKFRSELSRLRTPAERAELLSLSQTEEFASGDLETDAHYYEIYFRPAFWNSQLVNALIPRLRANSSSEGIRKARAIVERLVSETWLSTEYDLLPRLKDLNVPTLVIHGDSDFIPVAIAAQIAGAIPGARLVVLPDCGHFPLIERRGDLFAEVSSFLAS